MGRAGGQRICPLYIVLGFFLKKLPKSKIVPAPVTRNPRNAKVHHSYMSCKLPQISPRSFYVPLNYNVTATVNAKETPLPEGFFFFF